MGPGQQQGPALTLSPHHRTAVSYPSRFPSATFADLPEPPGEVGNIEDQIAAERVRTLYLRTPQSLLGGTVFAVVVAWAYLPRYGPALMGGWLLLKWLVLAWRALDWRHHRQDAGVQGRTAHWRWRHAAGSLVDGLTWGALGPMLLPSGNVMLDGTLVAGLVAVASVGVFTLSSHLGEALRFMAGVLVPTAIHYALQGRGSVSWLVSVGIAIYLVVLWVECRRAHDHTTELLRLRFENAAIAIERERARRDAEESSQAKSRFLATVSHELRTPLNGILGMAQLLGHDGLPPAQRERLKVLHGSAQHLLTLIDDLLDVSRIEFGRLELLRLPVQLRPLVQEVTDLLGPLAAAHGLKLQVRLAPELPERAMLDAARVRQVLHNLLGNALKFTEHGQVQLAIARQGRHLQFTVTDTGPGVNSQLRERIFDAFEQAPDARRHSGTGLGLTISRQLARAMGGDITVGNAPTGGACFSFTLAFEPVGDNATSGPALPDQAASAQGLHGHVLVVEDNPVNALVINGMLANLGLSSGLAEDGQQALDQLATTRFDLVLLDCQMPVLDGWETARQWRQREAAATPAVARLPIVALTANAAPGDRERCLQAGMDDYLAKPLTLETLAECLARYLPAAR